MADSSFREDGATARFSGQTNSIQTQAPTSVHYIPQQYIKMKQVAWAMPNAHYRFDFTSTEPHIGSRILSSQKLRSYPGGPDGIDYHDARHRCSAVFRNCPETDSSGFGRGRPDSSAAHGIQYDVASYHALGCASWPHLRTGAIKPVEQMPMWHAFQAWLAVRRLQASWVFCCDKAGVQSWWELTTTSMINE
jgi:hypothetical protein